ncbi:hypothetical protein A2U01_0059293, partial [Trifolium medium]|nr:hypothetical protein [Trifolium medium]
AATCAIASCAALCSLRARFHRQTPKCTNPILVNVRKHNQLIHKLNLWVPNSNSSNSVARSSTSGRVVLSRSAAHQEEGVLRSSPSRHRTGMKMVNSISSAGAVLCCSSLNSSDIRNCNKRFVDNYA